MAISTTNSKSKSPAGPKSRLPAAVRRALIVDAALEEFARRGYEAASVGRIAAAAGISRTVLYDHFPSKHALFVELLSAQHAALLAFIGKPIGMDIPMREQMQLTFDAFFRFAEERPLAWRLLFPDNPPLDEKVANEHRRRRAAANRVLAKMIEADVRALGVAPESDVGRAIFTIHQEAMHGAERWWRAHPKVPRAEVVRAVMATLWTGMSAVERGEPWVAEQ
jgi:AcrR family transcriptional regulator